MCRLCTFSRMVVEVLISQPGPNDGLSGESHAALGGTDVYRHSLLSSHVFYGFRRWLDWKSPSNSKSCRSHFTPIARRSLGRIQEQSIMKGNDPSESETACCGERPTPCSLEDSASELPDDKAKACPTIAQLARQPLWGPSLNPLPGCHEV